MYIYFALQAISDGVTFFVNWLYAINNINTDGVACAACGRAWVPGFCRPISDVQPITSEFKSILVLFDCESFG